MPRSGIPGDPGARPLLVAGRPRSSRRARRHSSTREADVVQRDEPVPQQLVLPHEMRQVGPAVTRRRSRRSIRGRAARGPCDTSAFLRLTRPPGSGRHRGGRDVSGARSRTCLPRGAMTSSIPTGSPIPMKYRGFSAGSIGAVRAERLEHLPPATLRPRARPQRSRRTRSRPCSPGSPPSGPG